MLQVDLNCDLGESFGSYVKGMDEEVIPLVTSCNIACGWHAGDPSVMHRTVALAKRAGISIGAHPGYHDLEGFGRRPMMISPDEAYDAIVYQVGALMGVCRTQSAHLKHVKPHGALYNRCAVDRSLADAVAKALYDLDPELIVVGLANGELIAAAEALGMRAAQEYFVDRNYDDEGHLVDRGKPGATIDDEAFAIERAVRAVSQCDIESMSGKPIDMQADTICIHGDGPHALAFARDIRRAFAEADIDIRAL